ncbi:hypothetical protein HanIR_Chr06g0291891 [Helianthus annuus]|nr:hypothetical protein HanIR_Chr06g0291891 [Helianthus annuus]
MTNFLPCVKTEKWNELNRNEVETRKTEKTVGANEETLDKWSEPRYLGGLIPHKRVSSLSVDSVAVELLLR